MGARRERGPTGGRRASRGAVAAVAALLALTVAPARADDRLRPGPAIAYPSDSLLAWSVLVVPAGATLESLFGSHWPIVARFNRIDRLHVRPGVRLKIPEAIHEAEEFTPLPRHYAPADSFSRFILVDLGEQFLGAYERGRLVMSFPVATGTAAHPTPTGDYKVDAADPDHHSSLYSMSDGRTPYPMHSGLRFHVSEDGEGYWLHGRDLPGRPASHGCIGLYDEAMQNLHYGVPRDPSLFDALRLFEWAVGPWPAGLGEHAVLDGPRVRILGEAPRAEQLTADSARP